MNEFELIVEMLADLNRRVQLLEGRTNSAEIPDFYKLLERMRTLLDMDSMNQFRLQQTPGPKPMTMEEAFKIAAEKLGPIRPILRCWPNKDGYRCAIGIGGAGRGHVVLAGGSTWEQAVNALDTYLAGPKHETCNICHNPDCENPNQKH